MRKPVKGPEKWDAGSSQLVGGRVEIWKPIPGTLGHYEASSLGRIRSADRTLVLSDGRVRKFPSVVLKPWLSGAKGKTYPYVRIRIDGVPQSVHLLVLLAFHGAKPDGCEARHLDGNRMNSRPSNLAWGTPLENAQDKKRHGTWGINQFNKSARTTNAVSIQR